MISLIKPPASSPYALKLRTSPYALKLVSSIETPAVMISLIKPPASSPYALKLRTSPCAELTMERWSSKGSDLSRMVATHAVTFVCHAWRLSSGVLPLLSIVVRRTSAYESFGGFVLAVLGFL
jgi:hypothetical protein